MDKSSAVYRRAVEQANAEYGTKSSIYRSSRIVTLYKNLGGKLSGTKKPKGQGLSRWFREAWVQVVPYLERGVVIECGGARAGANRGKACRPLHRITKETPITIKELLQLHSKSEIIRVAKRKERAPSTRVLWKTLTVCAAP